MFSVYTSAFNLEKCKFDYKRSLLNFAYFIGHSDGEIVIAVPRLKDDNTYELLLKYRETLKVICPNIFIYLCNFSPDSPEFDGAVKNFALEHCTKDILIQMDLDEIIPLDQKDKWVAYGEYLNYQDNFKSFMIPILEVWGDISKIRKDHGVKLKWRMHKRGLKRGVINYALRPDGTHDTNLSDGCELLSQDGELVKTERLISPECFESLSNYLDYLSKNIYTIHLGYLNLEDKILRNKEFWKDHWAVENGSPVKIAERKEELEYPVVEHGLFKS